MKFVSIHVSFAYFILVFCIRFHRNAPRIHLFSIRMEYVLVATVLNTFSFWENGWVPLVSQWVKRSICVRSVEARNGVHKCSRNYFKNVDDTHKCFWIRYRDRTPAYTIASQTISKKSTRSSQNILAVHIYKNFLFFLRGPSRSTFSFFLLLSLSTCPVLPEQCYKL